MDDSSPAILENFTPNMQIVFDSAMDIITFEDIENNKTEQKLDILRNYYLGEARDNQFDSDYIERSICIQEIMLINRYLTNDLDSYRKVQKFESFNDYFDTLKVEIKKMFPSRIQKTIIVNKQAAFRKMAS